MVPRVTARRVPELFLGLVAIGIAVVLVAHIFSGTIKDVRHTRDTLSVTGSARVPISADLVRWSLSVSPEAPTPAAAARLMRSQAAVVHTFLSHAGIPAAAISSAVVETEERVTPLPHHRRRIRYRVSQRLDVATKQIDVVERASTTVGG